MKIGLFGGTFDPIHYGHLRTALELKGLLELEKVHIVPCANPPHRTAPMTDGALRLRMVEAAVAVGIGLAGNPDGSPAAARLSHAGKDSDTVSTIARPDDYGRIIAYA